MPFCFSTAAQDLFTEIEGPHPGGGAAHRDKSREWGRLEAEVEPLLIFGNSGERQRDADTKRCVFRNR